MTSDTAGDSTADSAELGDDTSGDSGADSAADSALNAETAADTDAPDTDAPDTDAPDTSEDTADDSADDSALQADTALDSAPSTDSATDSADDSAADSPVGPATNTVDALASGDLLITEIMANPADCVDDDAEYLELLYQGQIDVDLAGLVFTDNNGSFTFPSVILAHGDRLLLWRDPDTTQCYGFTDGIAWPQVRALSNSGDVISFTTPSGTVVDTVDFSLWASNALVGVSWQLSDDVVDHLANNAQSAWCPATDVIAPPGTDLGSPGGPNGLCPPL